MIFRRRQDEMEGFRRMREALRQQADPQDHALLDDQYGAYDDEDAELTEEDEELVDETLDEAEAGEYAPYAGAAAVGTEAEAGTPSVQAAAPTPLPYPPSENPSMTTIGADTSWSGTLKSESDVYLEGRVEGTLEVRDTIYIAERATIDARLKARSVVVSGQITGHIDCEGRLEITPTGRLSGEVEAGSLVVHEGAVLDGKFKMKSSAASQSR